MNTVDYIETIDCGLCHEPVDKEDRAQVQGRSTWLYYWIWIPIACAIESRSSLYQVYSELWLINSIKLGKYKQWLGG